MCMMRALFTKICGCCLLVENSSHFSLAAVPFLQVTAESSVVIGKGWCLSSLVLSCLVPVPESPFAPMVSWWLVLGEFFSCSQPYVHFLQAMEDGQTLWVFLLASPLLSLPLCPPVFKVLDWLVQTASLCTEHRWPEVSELLWLLFSSSCPGTALVGEHR